MRRRPCCRSLEGGVGLPLQLGTKQVALPFNVEGDGPEPFQVAPDLGVGQMRSLFV